jgi:hypothetical protein
VQSDSWGLTDRERLIILVMIVLEMLCIISSHTLLINLCVKGFGKWIYSAMKIDGNILGYSSCKWTNYRLESGILVYSSTFFLNSILDGYKLINQIMMNKNLTL